MIESYKNIKLLFSKDVYKLFILFFLSLISTVLEIFSLGLIPVFVMVITDLNLLLSKISEIDFLKFFTSYSPTRILITSSIFLIVTFVIKNLFLFFIIFYQGKTTANLRYHISNKLFSHYLYMKYEKLINKNPGTIINAVHSDVSNAFIYVQAFLTLGREILILISILLLLFFSNYFISSIAILSLGLPIASFYYFYRNKLKFRGKQLRLLFGKKFKTINQALGSFKELKLMSREKFFEKNFLKINNETEKLSLFSYLISSTPRLFLEVTALFSIAIISVILFLSENNSGSIIPLISLLAVTAVRLVPSLNTITSSLTTMRFRKPSFDLIIEELQEAKEEKKQLNYKNLENKNEQTEIKFEKEIVFRDVHFNYFRTDRRVLKNINLKINKGSQVGIIGRSGAGKSTFVDLILGLLKPQKGTIFIDDTNLNENTRSWQKKIGYIPQDIYILDDSIRNNISFGVDGDKIDKNLINKALKMSQLERFVSSLPEKENTVVGNRGVKLSGGERQRIAIARAIYNSPDILILDEATSALDIDNENKILKEMKEHLQNKTKIIISHRNNTVKWCDVIYVIENGEIIDKGSFDDVMSRNIFLKEKKSSENIS